MTTFNELKLLCIIMRRKKATDYCICECPNVDYRVCDGQCQKFKFKIRSGNYNEFKGVENEKYNSN